MRLVESNYRRPPVRLARLGMRAEQWHQRGKFRTLRIVEVREGAVGFLRLPCQAPTIEGQKRIPRRNSDALVAILEGTAQRETFPEGRGFLDHIGIIADLRSK
jgi:hypothetical protein